ncbi:hypothetical protein ACHQM5_009474 [Ranunculus cassubicifolius]
MPTPPWMKGPLLLPSTDILDLSKPKIKKIDEEQSDDRDLTERIKGRRGKHTIRKIAQRVTNLGRFRNSEEPQGVKFEFGVKLEQQACREDDGRLGGKNLPWEKAERIAVFRRMKKEKVKTAAETRLSEAVLKRLRSDAERMNKWVKVKKAGVTEVALEEIRRIWESEELAMVKFELPLCRNMDRAREILETKTGGLVVWSWKDRHVIYRGDALKESHKLRLERTSHVEHPSSNLDLPSVSGTLYEREADRLLDGLGPRFVDWWYPKPLPVDADMLPEVVSGFKTPLRRCPQDIRPKLADHELTYLRKLARHLPTHFALGRNRKLQGLATAIMKLWEKSLVAKIAVKLGIPNSNSQQMALELQRLTGGVLILRNQFYIIFYRGKDFLPLEVSNMVVDREAELIRRQLKAEESTRWKSIEPYSVTNETNLPTSSTGTFSEFQHLQTKFGLLSSHKRESDIKMEADIEKLEKEIRDQEHKLTLLSRKIERSTRELSKINSAWKISEKDVDQELITDEERNSLLKMGLKMNRTLVLGRRGVFDGIIGSMHQHWKHREVVKVITMQRSFSQIMNGATLIEIESGGILIGIEKLRKGHAIVYYRGKNYKRPLNLVPKNLLTKRAALQRSLLMQKLGSLKYVAYQRQQAISDSKTELKCVREKIKKIVSREPERLQKTSENDPFHAERRYVYGPAQ